MSQAIAAWVLVFLVGGAAGVVAMLLCHYLLTFGGEDAANKHGISKVSATRLGGVAIVAYIFMHLGYQVYLGVYPVGLEQVWLMGVCLAFFLLGVYEDLRGSLSARVRFLSMLGIGSAAMLLSSIASAVSEAAPISSLIARTSATAALPSSTATAPAATA